MKKLNRKERRRIRRRNILRRWRGERLSARSRKFGRERKVYRERNKEYFALKRRRENLRKQVYDRSYKGPPKEVRIAAPFGLEEGKEGAAFIEAAELLIDFENRVLTIDLARCTRVWPSGVTLLCSLAKWVELTSSGRRRPQIRSIRPSSDAVHSYLWHCGFYDFVKIEHTFAPTDDSYSKEEVVRIQRETAPRNIESREDQIVNLLARHSSLPEEGVELFNAKVLTEVFSNVTEHGVAKSGEQGWWVLAQYHPTHRIISLCVADNGIGLRHSLLTGPQRDDILRLVPEGSGDGDFIKLALEKSVSGALDAPKKTEGMTRSLLTGGLVEPWYERGAHRGNGLKRIRETCKTLGIPFSITSHKGYAYVDSRGDISAVKSRSHRVFGGAMYHFTIPCGEAES